MFMGLQVFLVFGYRHSESLLQLVGVVRPDSGIMLEPGSMQIVNANGKE